MMKPAGPGDEPQSSTVIILSHGAWKGTDSMTKIQTPRHIGSSGLVLLGLAVAVLGTLPVVAVYLADRLTGRKPVKR
jgi:hypothetical protein